MKKTAIYLLSLTFICGSGASFAQASAPVGKASPSPVSQPGQASPKRLEKAPAASAKKDYQPRLAAFPDVGQAFNMSWTYSDKGQPSVVYGSPNTDNFLWQFSCGRKANIITQNQKIAPTYPVTGILSATTVDLRPDDQFGFTIRVDNGRSQGLLGQLGPIKIGNNDFNMPELVLDADNPLFEKLANGKRAFLKIDGNRFSVDLAGSLQPIRQFVAACKAKVTSEIAAGPR
jgi:hypothetical protein